MINGGFIGGGGPPVLSVQFGTIAFGAADTSKDSGALTPFVVADSVVILLGHTQSNGATAAQFDVHVQIKDTTTVTALRHTAVANSAVVAFAVISFPPGAVKTNQNFIITITNGNASANSAALTAVDLNKILPIPRGADYDTADALSSQGRWSGYWTMTSSTIATGVRNDAGGDTLIMYGTIVEFY